MPLELRDHRRTQAESIDQSKLLDSLHDQVSDNPKIKLRRSGCLPFSKVSQLYSSLDDIGKEGLVLIVFDGTWKHAKETAVASSSFLSKFTVQVCLDFDAAKDGGTIFDSELILRKERFAGCMSMTEAVARCLRILKTNGDDIESKIVEVLTFKSYGELSAIEARTKLVKNNADKNELDDGMHCHFVESDRYISDLMI